MILERDDQEKQSVVIMQLYRHEGNFAEYTPAKEFLTRLSHIAD